MVVRASSTGRGVDSILDVSLLEKGDIPIQKEIFFTDASAAIICLNKAKEHVSLFFKGTELEKQVLSSRVVKYHLTIIEIGNC